MNQLIVTIGIVATLITSLNTIVTLIITSGKKSKHGIDKYIEKQMSPGLEAINTNLTTMRTMITNDINDLRKTADEREMQRLRYECLCFASDVRKGDAKTRPEYEEVFRMESSYEELIDRYHIKNGYMAEEMLYLHKQYRLLVNNEKGA